jgi:hypothetical protein
MCWGLARNCRFTVYLHTLWVFVITQCGFTLIPGQERVNRLAWHWLELRDFEVWWLSVDFIHIWQRTITSREIA